MVDDTKRPNDKTGDKTSRRGFASMDPERQRAIAKKGGQSVPDDKRSFSRNPQLAAAAGRKGGQSVPDAKRSFSQDHMLAAEAGRKGGQNSRRAARGAVKGNGAGGTRRGGQAARDVSEQND